MQETKAKYLKQLKEKTFHKLIIGAALKDYQAIENFSYYFTHAEADVLDISAFPHSVLCAKKGIEKALQEDSTLTEPLIMVSVNIGEDPHFRRIEINWDNCTECLACVPTCPSSAFSATRHPSPVTQFSYNENLCFGCSNCLPSCNFDALNFETWDAFKTESLIELQELGARAIEIHLNNDLEAFKTFYFNMPEFELESFCIGSEKMTKKDLELATEAVIEAVLAKNGLYHINSLTEKDSDARLASTKFTLVNEDSRNAASGTFQSGYFVIQTDGIPMSGARDMGNIEKDLVSMDNAKIVKEYIHKNYAELEKNIFVQLAGGITEASLKKAKKRKLGINGVAIGSYARKVLDQSATPILTAKELIRLSKLD